MKAFAAWILYMVAMVGSSAFAAEETYNVSNTTPNCSDSRQVPHQVCCRSGEVTHYSLEPTSQNGNASDIVSHDYDSRNPACVRFTTYVAPFGEDCIDIPFLGKQCNCKGRGWLHIRVRLQCE